MPAAGEIEPIMWKGRRVRRGRVELIEDEITREYITYPDGLTSACVTRCVVGVRQKRVEWGDDGEMRLI
jgi:hypothetical protein